MKKKEALIIIVCIIAVAVFLFCVNIQIEFATDAALRAVTGG